TLLHRPQRIARVARLDMDKILRREAWWMDPSAFEDRHPLLDPEQRLLAVQLSEQEARPAAVAWVDSEELGQGRAGRSWQEPSAVQPAGELTNFGRATFAAGDQGKACSHTTHNVFVLLLFFIR